MLSEGFRADAGKLTLNVGGRSHQLVPCTELERESRWRKGFHPLLLCDCRQIGAEPPIPTTTPSHQDGPSASLRLNKAFVKTKLCQVFGHGYKESKALTEGLSVLSGHFQWAWSLS